MENMRKKRCFAVLFCLRFASHQRGPKSCTRASLAPPRNGYNTTCRVRAIAEQKPRITKPPTGQQRSAAGLCMRCETKEKCDILFIPIDKNEVFPENENLKKIESGKLGDELCGKIRPGHFNGVLTVVNKIFEMIKPDIAIFGAKDYQQQILIKQMAENLHPSLSLLKAPIIRSKNGVALSSRNNYLSEKEIKLASNLFKCLENSVRSYKKNIRLCEIIENAKKFLISKNLDPDYFELRDSKLNSIKDNNFNGKKILLSSVKINKTRLIDNIEF